MLRCCFQHCSVNCFALLRAYMNSNLKRIIILQNNIIRIISKVSFDSHTDVLFKEQMILKVPDIYLYQIGKFMYLFKKGLLPNYFQDMFILATQVHSYNTRNSNRKFYIFPFRTNFRKFSIRFQGPKFFNSLNQEIQDSESISLFAKRLNVPSYLVTSTPLKSYILVFFLFVLLSLFFLIPNNIFTYSVPEIYCLPYIGSQEAYSP